jgi:membrane fusion protein (multidrug efflux system)
MDGSQPVSPAVSGVSLAAKPPARKRRLVLCLLLLALIAGGGSYGYHWWTVLRFFESTDDAYTQADGVGVASRVSGYVAEVLVGDNQIVAAGQKLARIDARDYQAALDQAEADILSADADQRSAESQIAVQQAAVTQAEADIVSADAALTFARADYTRYTDLAHTGNGTVQRAQQAEQDIRQREAAVAHARAVLASATAEIDVLAAQKARAAASRAHAMAAAQQARLNLSYTVITAPVAGAVGDRQLRLGQYVAPGTRILDVVPTGRDIYVVANFKETQLREMWRGESADVTLDMLPGLTLHGHIDSLAPGSGAQFALLPPENATGNFTKIVQRVPVKIVLDVTDPVLLTQLRPGLSVIARVDTRTKPAGPGQTLVAGNTP